MIVTATRVIEFCAGHRVMGHENKCAHLHGHNYRVELTAEREDPDNGATDTIGRVVDFSVLKERIGGWIDDNWDHGFLFSQHDQHTQDALNTFIRMSGIKQKFFLMPCNPTAENIASYLLQQGNQELYGTAVKLVRVRVWETPNCYAEVEL